MVENRKGRKRVKHGDPLTKATEERPAFTQTLLERALKQLDENYLAERKAECERLHNRLAEVIAEEKASPQNTLYVLQILQFEVLQDEFRKLFGPG